MSSTVNFFCFVFLTVSCSVLRFAYYSYYSCKSLAFEAQRFFQGLRLDIFYISSFCHEQQQKKNIQAEDLTVLKPILVK